MSVSVRDRSDGSEGQIAKFGNDHVPTSSKVHAHFGENSRPDADGSSAFVVGLPSSGGSTMPLRKADDVTRVLDNPSAPKPPAVAYPNMQRTPISGTCADLGKPSPSQGGAVLPETWRPDRSKI